MKLQPTAGAAAKLSHHELIRLLVADSRRQPVAQEFITRYDNLIRATAARALYKKKMEVAREFIPLMIEDVVNETYCRLFRQNCQALRLFQGRHENSIFAYLRTICLNVVRNQFRDYQRKDSPWRLHSINEIEEKSGGAPAERDPASASAVAAEADAAEFKMLQQMIRAIISQAFRAAHANRNYIIFKLHFLHGYHGHEIARIKALGLGESGVGNAIDRIRHFLRLEFARRSIAS
jgi:RNA polymerase sigma-70 factor (ECF subfamily)